MSAPKGPEATTTHPVRPAGLRPAARSAAVALLVLATVPARAQERVGDWILQGGGPGGRVCTLSRGGPDGALEFVDVGSDILVDASSARWFVGNGMSYRVGIAVDGALSTEIRAAGLDPHLLHLLPNGGLPTAPILERLASARTLAITKLDNPRPQTVTVPLEGFAEALGRLKACTKARLSKVEGGRAAIRERCLKLADAVARETGGKRADTADIDQNAERVSVVVEHPAATMLAVCGATARASRVTLLRREAGFPAAMLDLAARVAGILTGRAGTSYSGLPAECLKRVTTTRVTRGKRGGSRTETSQATSSTGTVVGPGLSLTCQYRNAMEEPRIYLEQR